MARRTARGVGSSDVLAHHRRGNKLYAKIKDVDGVWRRVTTGLDVGQEDAALVWVREREREVADELRKRGTTDAPLTLTRYVAEWLDKRHTKTVGDDRARLLHVTSRIGDMLLVDIRPRHVRDVMLLRSKAEGTSFPRRAPSARSPACCTPSSRAR